MTDYKYASDCFQKIMNKVPANCCAASVLDNKTVLDLGKDVPGGWTSCQLMLEALIAGRGLVNIARDLRGMHQFPAIEMFYDDPVGAAAIFTPDADGVCGVKEGGAYAFGVCVDEVPEGACGNIALTGRTSLAFACLDAARALPEAVSHLLADGIEKEAIQWAWSFAPVADLSNSADTLSENCEKARKRRTISIWLRGDDEQLQRLAESFEPGTLRLHNLTTAHTLMPEGPAKRINAEH